MNHDMSLNPRPFDQIKTGQKTIEIRCNDEKRQKVGVGEKEEKYGALGIRIRPID